MLSQGLMDILCMLQHCVHIKTCMRVTAPPRIFHASKQCAGMLSFDSNSLALVADKLRAMRTCSVELVLSGEIEHLLNTLFSFRCGTAILFGTSWCHVLFPPTASAR